MSINYKEKYLKYKTKFLNLKGGGCLDVFYIYTTGVIGWSNECAILQYWTESKIPGYKSIFNVIEKNIPEKITTIYIIHSDPLYIDNSNKESKKKESALKKINDIMIKPIESNVPKRKVISKFTTELLDFNLIKSWPLPYLIIDFGYIFTHTQIPKQVKYDELTYDNLNVVYFGSINSEQDYNKYFDIFNSKFFVVNANTVTTYIEKLQSLPEFKDNDQDKNNIAFEFTNEYCEYLKKNQSMVGIRIKYLNRIYSTFPELFLIDLAKQIKYNYIIHKNPIVDKINKQEVAKYVEHDMINNKYENLNVKLSVIIELLIDYIMEPNNSPLTFESITTNVEKIISGENIILPTEFALGSGSGSGFTVCVDLSEPYIDKPRILVCLLYIVTNEQDTNIIKKINSDNTTDLFTKLDKIPSINLVKQPIDNNLGLKTIPYIESIFQPGNLRLIRYGGGDEIRESEVLLEYKITSEPTEILKIRIKQSIKEALNRSKKIGDETMEKQPEFDKVKLDKSTWEFTILISKINKKETPDYISILFNNWLVSDRVKNDRDNIRYNNEYDNVTFVGDLRFPLVGIFDAKGCISEMKPDYRIPSKNAKFNTLSPAQEDTHWVIGDGYHFGSDQAQIDISQCI
jgi:hypothetical protein